MALKNEKPGGQSECRQLQLPSSTVVLSLPTLKSLRTCGINQFMEEQYEIMLLGDTGVGKTRLVMQLWPGRADTEPIDPTIEDTYRKSYVIDGTPILMQIFDTVAQDGLMESYEWSVTGQGYILVYSISSRESFQNLQRYKDKANSTGSKYGFTGTVPILLVGNKMDLPNDLRQVTTQEGEDLAAQWNAEFMETTTITGLMDVAPVFERMVRQIRASGMLGAYPTNPSVGKKPNSLRQCIVM